MARIVRIWIEEDVCLAHGLCEQECPEVFELPEDSLSAKIRPDAAKYYETKEDEIMSAVNCCPMDCIKIQREGESVQPQREARGWRDFFHNLFSR